MPWSETTAMQQKTQFIADYLRDRYTISELCERYRISRKTGYKWAERYMLEGLDGLRDRSRAPKRCSHRTPEAVEQALVEARRRHPTWGPRKLLWKLRRLRPALPWPAPSTAGDILRRHGLVERRPSRRRFEHPGKPKFEALAANDVWTGDYKGECRTGDRRYCYPLTVADLKSRCLLGLEGKLSTAELGARKSFERLFRENGMPKAILTDNGSPFSSPALCGLSRLSMWWIKLDIRVLRTEPSHPEQNGAHERMHRTLKAETTRPPASNLRGQQRRFDAFRREYNEERPHEALGMLPPREAYEPSPRPYPDCVPEVEYPGHFELRQVRRDGSIKWKGRYLFVTTVLHGEPIGLEEVDDGIWSLHFGPLLLARFDERDQRLRTEAPDSGPNES